MADVIIYDSPGSQIDVGSLAPSYRIVVTADNISGNASKIKLRLKAHGTQNYTINGCSIGERSSTSDDFTSGPTRVTFGGNNSVTVSAGVDAYSDEITFTIDETKTYLVHLYAVTSTFGTRFTLTGNTYYYYNADTNDYTMNQNVTFNSATGYVYYLDQIIAANVASASASPSA